MEENERDIFYLFVCLCLFVPRMYTHATPTLVNLFSVQESRCCCFQCDTRLSRRASAKGVVGVVLEWLVISSLKVLMDSQTNPLTPFAVSGSGAFHGPTKSLSTQLSNTDIIKRDCVCFCKYSNGESQSTIFSAAKTLAFLLVTAKTESGCE